MYHISILSNNEKIAEILDELYMEELDFHVYCIQDYVPSPEELDGPVIIYFEEQEDRKENRIMEIEMLRYRNHQKDSMIIAILKDATVYSLRNALELHVDETIIRTDYPREEDFVKKRQDILRSMVYSLLLRKKTIQERIRLEEYEFHNQQKFMDSLLTNILEKPREVEYLLPEINHRYHTRFGTGVYQVMVISMDRYDLYNKETSYVKDLTMMAMHILRTARQIVFGSYKLYGLVAVLHYPDFASREQKEGEWIRLKKEIQKLTYKYGDFSTQIGVGNAKRKLTEIWDSFQEGLLVVEYHSIAKREVYVAEDFEQTVQPLNKFVPSYKIKELSRYVALGEYRHVNSWFLDFYQHMEHKFRAYPPAYAVFPWIVYQNMLELEKNTGISLFPEWKFITIQHILDGRERIEALQKTLVEICRMLENGVTEKQELALRAIAYMQMHYQEQITLETIAENCGLSPSYFSRKFKEQTGENYIETLSDIRIREAQKLLGTTDLPIMKIVEKVGYCDEKHFRKLFLKHAGMTPSAYRKSIKHQYDRVEKSKKTC